jgi:hypothetical protein
MDELIFNTAESTDEEYSTFGNTIGVVRMANAAHLSHLAPYSTQEASLQSNINAKKHGVLWRIFDAIVESRQKSINREIALRLARSGGRITDSIEREITQSLLKGNFKVHD